MAKCAICNERKAKRYCAALDKYICSYCCGTMRGKEIECFEGCRYLKRGTEYSITRQIDKKITGEFPDRSKDVFRNPDAALFAAPLEEFFVNEFYGDRDVSDGDIYEALSTIYAFRTGLISKCKPQNQYEEMIFDKFAQLDREHQNLTPRLKDLVILRILRSIKMSSGGILGSRNYLETIHS